MNKSTASLGGLHPLLFAAFPVLFLWSENVDEIAPGDVTEPLLIVLTAAAIATAVIGLLLRDLRRGALVVTPIVAWLLLSGHVETLTDAPPGLLQAGWVGLIIVGTIGALRLGAPRLGSIDRALLALGAVLVTVSMVTIVPVTIEDALAPRPILAADAALPTTTSAAKRDVYWLIFDRYGSDRSLELQFGVRSDLTPWLREHGFQVLPDSHANYVSTGLSLATTLNMAHLEDLTSAVYRNSSSYAPVYAALQSSRVVRQFRALGYRYVHLGSWYNATRSDVAADVNYNADNGSDFRSVLIEMSAVPIVTDVLGIEGEPPSESTKHLAHNRFALDTLDRIRSETGPKFVLAHVLLPHPPYVFDRDGRYIGPDEASTLTMADGWNRQLDYTNRRLKAFLEGLLALPPDRQPIIILQADEGPWTDAFTTQRNDYDWANASPNELEIKFGIMNAWYLPGHEDLALDPAMTAINTYPVLFTRYFGLDGYSLLPDRVATSRGGRPYLLTDVTARLPSLN